MNDLIALLTDFGTEDIYVGVMKGVMLSIHPEARLIDISHAVPPQNVRVGAFTLLNSYRFFPEGTIFLVVVDPGVGSTRNPIAVKAGGYTFVAPDNGILSYVLEELGEPQAVLLEKPIYRRSEVSHTFHGRDVFAPAAAYLAQGYASLADFGPRLDKLFTLPQPELTIEKGHIIGEVVHIDHFGNITTSIGKIRWLDDDYVVLEPRFGEQYVPIKIKANALEVCILGEKIYALNRAFHEGARGSLVAIAESNGYLEIAVNQGDARKRLNTVAGDKVEVRLSAG